MAEIIKLTRAKNNAPVYVNFDNVSYFNNYREVTKIVFNNTSENKTIGVIESPEEIIKALNEQN
jgi:hypothetical protein